MSTKDFTANVISATKVVPDGNFKDSKASGIWDINEALDLIKGGNWPNVANINPAAFVDALFQTHLYTGTGSAQTITNGIDLSGKGGLVWIKDRGAGFGHNLFDTARGVGKYINSDGDAAEATDTTRLSAFNSNGFSLGSQGSVNTNTNSLVSWTFRKQPKFFDIVTYTGDGQDGGRAISHNLGSVPGMMLVKRTSSDRKWTVYHRGNTAAPETDVLVLNETDATSDLGSAWYDTEPTASVFTIGDQIGVNANGETYVAYLFAHNNNDGGFGEPGDQDIIKCGSYTGNGSTQSISLGFEPQFIILKSSSSASNWVMFDNMRGVVTSSSAADDKYLFPNSDTTEGGGIPINFTATGFDLDNEDTSNKSSDTFIYMAIRRGGMQTPTAASDVFHANKFTSTGFTEYTGVGFAPDLAIQKAVSSGDNWDVVDKLRGPSNYIKTNSTDTEAADTQYELGGFLNNGVKMGTSTSGQFNGWNPNLHLYWRRARGYFDMVAYTGTSPNAGDTKSHNLGVVPEMIWLKNRNGASGGARSWMVYHKQTANTGYLKLDANSALITSDPQDKFGNNTVGVSPTASVFTVAGDYQVNYDGDTYIAYLFATVANVSKVGSFTQSGATNVDCGFTGSTPALIILKRTDAAGDWYLFDATRGIVAGNDKSLYLNTNAAEVTNADVVDPYSGGFATTSSLTNGDYIFYAIASIA